MLEELNSLVNGHLQYIVDRLALVLYLECLAVIAPSAAHLTWHVDVRQKMHLYLDYSVALARLASSSLDVERKASARISSRLGIGSLGEKLTDIRKHARIRRRI